LATLLQLREAARDERRAELAEAYRADTLIGQQIHALDTELKRLLEECRRAVSPGKIDVDRLLAAQRHELVLRAQIQFIGHQRQRLAAEIARRRQALVEANREVRVLEKLRHKQLERHQTEENRRDVKRLDEVAQQRAVREGSSR
jgi:flagellar FliJ protein